MPMQFMMSSHTLRPCLMTFDGYFSISITILADFVLHFYTIPYTNPSRPVVGITIHVFFITFSYVDIGAPKLRYPQIINFHDFPLYTYYKPSIDWSTPEKPPLLHHLQPIEQQCSKNPSIIPFYCLVYQDSSIGFLESPIHWVVYECIRPH